MKRIPTRLPDLEHWKAQVKCQAGCPVATDAGRYVQLIAEGREEEAYLVARAPNPFASVCGRVCAAQPQVVGIHEMAYGFAFVLIVALGYALDF